MRFTQNHTGGSSCSRRMCHALISGGLSHSLCMLNEQLEIMVHKCKGRLNKAIVVSGGMYHIVNP